ncbi:MAG TPA: DMT family transporter [Chitinophagaceae bacterium]|nr:DMT family transporter [Chitinophagaceae bacterium]
MENSFLFIVLALAAGMMIPFQSAMNAQLGKALQSPYYASLTVFAVAATSLLIYIAASRYAIPSSQQFATAPKWSYLGGILGGAYILLIVICAPKLGIGNVTVLVLLGQILSAIVIDQFGLLNSVVHTLNWQRILGVILMIAGVYLVKKF